MDIAELEVALGNEEIGKVARRYLRKAVKKSVEVGAPEDGALFIAGPKAGFAAKHIARIIQGEGYTPNLSSVILNDKFVWVIQVKDGDREGYLTRQGLPRRVYDYTPLPRPYAYKEGAVIFDYPAYEGGMDGVQRYHLTKRLPHTQKYDPESYEDDKNLLKLDDEARAANDPRHAAQQRERELARATIAGHGIPRIYIPDADLSAEFCDETTELYEQVANLRGLTESQQKNVRDQMAEWQERCPPDWESPAPRAVVVLDLQPAPAQPQGNLFDAPELTRTGQATLPGVGVSRRGQFGRQQRMEVGPPVKPVGRNKVQAAVSRARSNARRFAPGGKRR